MTLSDEFARFAVEYQWDDAPTHVRAAAARTTGNALALCVGAADHPATQACVATVARIGTPPEARLLARSERASPIWTALVHGISAHVEDYDDTHPRTLVHPGSAIVPAALAASECAPCTGPELLTAVLVGTEVALRLGSCFAACAIERGWHMTGLAGHVGAAAAAGRVLRLSVEKQVSALGIAAIQGAGLTEALGTMTKSLHPGKAASNGVEAAQLAAAGLRGPRLPLEGGKGMLALLTGETDTTLGLSELGQVWQTVENEVKPYSCGVLGHSTVDLARWLRTVLSPSSGLDVVELQVHPLVLEAMGRADPHNGLESKFSVHHCFAVGYLHDRAGPEQFTDEVAANAAVARLRRRVNVQPVEELGRYEVRARIQTSQGQWLARTHQAPRPLDTAGLQSKIVDLARPVLGQSADPFAEVVLNLDSLTSLNPLWRIAQR